VRNEDQDAIMMSNSAYVLGSGGWRRGRSCEG